MTHASFPVFVLESILIFLILHKIFSARRGKALFIRRIAGLSAIDEAVGRATEMGRPIFFSTGLGGLDIVSLQALSVMAHVVRLAARFRTRVLVALADAVLYTIAQEVTREAYTREGTPELYEPDDVRFLSDQQFAYASASIGLMSREKTASCFYFGSFFAESLILAETGHHVGAIQVAGTPDTTQLPFFIAACDYTIIGDEFYAGSAYLSREPTLLGSLVGQDHAKLVIVASIILGVLGVSMAHWFPHGLAVLQWFTMAKGQ